MSGLAASLLLIAGLIGLTAILGIAVVVVINWAYRLSIR